MGSKSQREISERDISTRVAVALEAVEVALEAANTADGAGAFSVTYVFPAKDWGAEWTEVINTPAGFRGLVKAAVIYDVTEIFSAVGSDARVDVGDGTDVDAFAITGGLGTTGVDASAAPAITLGVTGTIPVADIVTITGIAAGTPGTGIATLALTINYFV